MREVGVDFRADVAFEQVHVRMRTVRIHVGGQPILALVRRDRVVVAVDVAGRALLHHHAVTQVVEDVVLDQVVGRAVRGDDAVREPAGALVHAVVEEAVAHLATERPVEVDVSELRHLALDVLDPTVRAGEDLEVRVALETGRADALEVQVLDAGVKRHRIAAVELPHLGRLGCHVCVVERRVERDVLAADRRDLDDLTQRAGAIVAALVVHVDDLDPVVDLVDHHEVTGGERATRRERDRGRALGRAARDVDAGRRARPVAELDAVPGGVGLQARRVRPSAAQHDAFGDGERAVESVGARRHVHHLPCRAGRDGALDRVGVVADTVALRAVARLDVGADGTPRGDATGHAGVPVDAAVGRDRLRPSGFGDDRRQDQRGR